MSLPLRSLLPLSVACLAWGLDGIDPKEPLPRVAPLAPVLEPERPADTEAEALRAMERAVREREARIQEILRLGAGVRPTAAPDLGPGLGKPRADRDAALSELRTALGEWLGRTHRADRDVLDAASPARQAVQGDALSADNRLAIAECLRELALDERAPERDRLLAEGLAELEHLPSELAAHQQPRAAWLRVFFLAEQARAAPAGPARTDLAGRATAAAEAFAAAHPDSDLGTAVAALVAGLP